jgi:hypothetical protein
MHRLAEIWLATIALTIVIATLGIARTPRKSVA